MRLTVLSLIMAFCCVFTAGCLSKYDPVSESHAERNVDGLEMDLNAGLDQDQVDVIVEQAFDIAYPAPEEPVADPVISEEDLAAYDAAVAERDATFERFRAKVYELTLAQSSVDIAIERARSWLRYEQSKRDPEPGDLPRGEGPPDGQ